MCKMHLETNLCTRIHVYGWEEKSKLLCCGKEIRSWLWLWLWIWIWLNIPRMALILTDFPTAMYTAEICEYQSHPRV